MSLSIHGGLKLGLSKVAARGWLADIGHKDLPVGAGEDPKPRQLDSQPALSDAPEYPPGLGEEGVSEVSEAAGMVKKCPLQPSPASAHRPQVPRPRDVVQEVQWGRLMRSLLGAHGALRRVWRVFHRVLCLVLGLYSSCYVP